VTAELIAGPRAAARPATLVAEAAALRAQFPPRVVPASWETTRADRDTVLARLLAPPFPLASATGQRQRRFGLIRILDWLQAQPGQTWQERWAACGADTGGRAARDWREGPLTWLRQAGQVAPGNTSAHKTLGAGLLQLICGDVIRPGIRWLLTATVPHNLAAEMARVRDPDGFAALRAAGQDAVVGEVIARCALTRIAFILAAKGGNVAGITVGDCLELLQASATDCDQYGGSGKGPYFYQLLHTAGVLPAGSPPTVRLFSSMYHGQLAPDQLIDRYRLSCRPIRDLLVDYLRERQPSLDYNSLAGLACDLGRLFWKDLEDHHPGISSLSLPAGMAAAWKQRIRTKPGRTAGIARTEPRSDVASCLNAVRAFYLDIAQWAAEDPARWGQWAAPCPVRASDVQSRKERSHRKSRMDQRTRERLPAVPALTAAAARARSDAAALLHAARAARPGQQFTAAGQTLCLVPLTKPSQRTWAEDSTGARRDLAREEDNAFWSWAAVEVLRHTGCRAEELTELSHHSLVQYRLPSTGELIPLLHIAPSKTDQERLLVISPELADVLACIVQRIREPAGAVPLVMAYDTGERVWNPPMPLLFQHRVGLENRPFGIAAVGRLVDTALAASGLTDRSGKPLLFVPHDFRRIFATDAILNGMPPHITQLLLGHKDINVTMGYKAVYPEEAISGHRAFITRRRQLRPAEEYRTPTDDEWDEFLGHFQRRRVALGECGHAYGTGCIHEHSCIRCPLLRVDPAQRARLDGIRSNLKARIGEARDHGWAGEVEGLKVSLAAAEAKLSQLDARRARRAEAVSLGMPSYRDISGHTAAIPSPRQPGQQAQDCPN
jgi:hypothetical protein